MKKSSERSSSEHASSPGKLATLSAAWPGLRYLSLGVLSVWAFLIMDPGNWKTSHFDVSAGGLIIYLVSALALLAAAFIPNAFRRFSELSASSVITAVIAILGALLLIASGSITDYSAGLSCAAFFLGGVLCGLGFALITLRVGQLYCELKPSKVLLYSLLSDIIVAVLFYIIIGNSGYANIGNRPSFVYYATMIAAPVVAMVLTCLPRSADMRNEEREPRERVSGISIRSLLSSVPAMRKLLISVFVFSVAASCVCNCFMVNLDIDSYQINVIRNMLFRLLFALCLLVASVLYEQLFSLSKLYHLDMLMLIMVISVVSLVGLKSGVLFSFTAALVNLFALIVWCLLTFVTKAFGVLPHLAFGLGMGCLYLGRAAGYLLKYLGVFDGVEAGGSMGLPMTAIIIALIVVCIGIFFTEKDFDEILKVSGASDINVRAALPANQIEKKHDKNDRPWYKACCVVGERAMLSNREQELFEALSRNQTPQEIAANLHISVATVRTHTHHIYVKIDVHSRDELIELVRSEYETLVL